MYKAKAAVDSLGRLLQRLSGLRDENRGEALVGERLDRLERSLDLLFRYQASSYWRAVDLIYEHTLADRRLACIVCGHVDLRDGFETRTSQCLFGGGKLERYVCPRCDCVFGPQKFLDLPQEYVDLEYEVAYSKYSEADSTENEIKAFRSLRPSANAGVYVDWGCGHWSNTIDRLRSENWEVWGYEPTSSNPPPFVATRPEHLPREVIGIFSNNVIEHLLDPVAQFMRFYAMLPSRGRMAHASPCYVWSYEFTRFHTFFPLGRSVEVLAARTGFRVIDRQKEGEWVNVVFEKT